MQLRLNQLGVAVTSGVKMCRFMKAYETCGGGKHIFHCLFASRSCLPQQGNPRLGGGISIIIYSFTGFMSCFWCVCMTVTLIWCTYDLYIHLMYTYKHTHGFWPLWSILYCFGGSHNASTFQIKQNKIKKIKQPQKQT